MGFAAPALLAVSAITSAVGAISKGQSEANMANYRGAIARNNAVISNRNSSTAYLAGEQESANQSMKTAGLLGRQLATQGAGGLDVNSGSPADVRASAAGLGALDALTIRNNAARKAYGFQSEAQGQTAEAALDSAAASNAKTQGWLGAGKSLLGAASSYATDFGGLGGGDSGTSDFPTFTNSASTDWSMYPGFGGATGMGPGPG